jgi:hypothetical protein
VLTELLPPHRLVRSSIGGEGEVCRGKRPVQRSGRKERKKERKERKKDLTFGAAAGSIPSTHPRLRRSCKLRERRKKRRKTNPVRSSTRNLCRLRRFRCCVLGEEGVESVRCRVAKLVFGAPFVHRRRITPVPHSEQSPLPNLLHRNNLLNFPLVLRRISAGDDGNRLWVGMDV